MSWDIEPVKLNIAALPKDVPIVKVRCHAMSTDIFIEKMVSDVYLGFE